jgi:purine-nucleoside/S-methyl-5'-thioadenosine phosphorylase / adenosine deaminase
VNSLITPGIFGGSVSAFFTGRQPGADPDQISRILKIKKEDIYLPVQKHTVEILVLESSLEPRIADAVITKREGVLIGVQVADCVPILLYEKKEGVIAAVHAGWRGTAEGILKKTIRVMTDKLGCSEKEILVAIGPSIRGCSYEVGAEVVDAVKQGTGQKGFAFLRGEKFFLDLAAANSLQARAVGVHEKNMWVSPDCTFCNPERYFSYRYGKGTAGRQGGFIGKL